MMSGLREAVRISDIFIRGTDYTSEVEVMEAAKRHSNIAKCEVKDIIQRLDAVEFSGLVYRNSLDRFQISTWGSMLKPQPGDCIWPLDLPVGFLKSFASTREGLSTLSTWILDAMEKVGSQLLHYCVRLLVLVLKDLLAFHLSDQHLNVWVELLRDLQGRLKWNLSH